jgi:hypothetical protein
MFTKVLGSIHGSHPIFDLAVPWGQETTCEPRFRGAQWRRIPTDLALEADVRGDSLMVI